MAPKGKKSRAPMPANSRSVPNRGPGSAARKGRAEIAADTLSLLNQGWYLSPPDDEGNQEVVSIAAQQAAALEKTVHYSPEESDRLLLEQRRQSSPTATSPNSENLPTQYVVCNRTTLDAVRQLAREIPSAKSIFCLNFASARNPGGGFLNGAQAQEESLARASGLYPCLVQPKVAAYYKVHNNKEDRSAFYTDHMIYSPDVPVFKYEDGSNMSTPLPVSFLTSAAVNAGVVRRDSLDDSEVEKRIEDAMKQRIAKVLTIAQAHGHEFLVLGAWGCGVFKNDPKSIATLFRQELNKFNCFRVVVFAIYSSSQTFLDPFQLEFGGPAAGNTP